MSLDRHEGGRRCSQHVNPAANVVLQPGDTLLGMSLAHGWHLTHGAAHLGEGGFWALHFDSLAVSILLGFVGLGFLRWVVAGATSGVPTETGVVSTGAENHQ